MRSFQEMFRASRWVSTFAVMVFVCSEALGGNAADAVRKLEVLGLASRVDAFPRAVAMRHDKLIELLFDARTNPDAADEAGRTPLHHAIAVRDWRLAKRLIESGANPNVADRDGVTPLMLSAVHGNAELVTDLLKKGAALDAVDTQNRPALHYALAARKLPVAHQLIEGGASVTLRDLDDRDALGLAADTRDWLTIAKILERSERRRWDFAGRSALQQAVNANQVDRVHLVMKTHVGAPTPEGCQSPLLAYAVAANDVKMTRLLLEAGADVNTTLDAPVEERFLEYVPEKVLRHYLTDEDGMTVLMVAAGLGHEQMVKLLLEKGAERGRATRSKHRLVPLYFAAWGGHAECMQALIANSPRPEEVRIEIRLGSQNATLYRDGVEAFSTGISTGKSGFSTPTGRFVVTDKKHSHVSSIYKVKMPFFMRLSCKDFGMHEGYVPEYPASHGCIRVPADAARKLFKEVPIGTLVTIVN